MIDPAAASFEPVAAEYDFGRPSWPAAAIASLGLRRASVLPHEEELSRDALLARIGSWSQFTSRPAEERKQLLAEIGGFLDKPSYRTRLETQLWTTRLVG